VKTPSILAWMFGAIALVAALLYWDAQRESAAALRDFGEEQATLAEAVAATLSARLTTTRKDAMAIATELVRVGAASSPGGEGDFQVRLRWRDEPESVPDDGQTFALRVPFDERRDVDIVVRSERLLAPVRSAERDGERRVFVKRPERLGLVTTSGVLVRARALEAAIEAGQPSLRLPREDAPLFGLPERTAMAGLAAVDAGTLGKWGVAVVATAQRERDREIHAKWRLVLGLIVVAGLVSLFGGWALRKQRKEADLARELAVAEATRAADTRLERADKLATMGALATGIAHEVATPLGVILGRAEQLAPRVAADEKATRAVRAIQEQGARIDHVVRGFLRLARGDRPTFTREDPAAIVTAAVDLAQHRFSKAHVTLEVAPLGALPKIACEPRLLEQVLVNLLLNACDACVEVGGGRVTVDARAASDKVTFEVVDDGAGIGEEAKQRATEAFYTTKPSGTGTGLGLAIATEIVKHHRGTLSLAPRAPRGTRAAVEIPLAEDA
jgi:two-component system, NtrC family, sensor kinase